MNTKSYLLVFSMVLFASLASAVEPDAELTLRDCYTLALERSETVGIQKELIKETEGQMLQSLSTALPKVAFAYSQKWQDEVEGHHWNSYTPEAKFTFSQPLFTGFKEFAAIGASKHIGKQRKAELKRAMQLLFVDVSDAFFLYLNYQEDENVLLETKAVLLERVVELKKRRKIGKSRLSEIASAEVGLRRIEAGLENIRSQKTVSRQLLEFLIGRSFSQLVDEGDPAMKLTEDMFYSRVDKRPDVMAAEESLRSYEKNVVAARASFFPTVTLSSNAYTKRSDAYDGNNWDVTLGVSVPIFNGLNDVGQVRQARAQKNQADLRLSQVRRSALLEIKNDFTQWQANGRRVAALDMAVTAAERNYRLQVQDFERNLVNNLDVLQALESLLIVRRDLVAAKTDARRSFWALKAATGDVP